MQNRLNLKVWDSSQLPADWYKRASATDESETASVEAKVKAIVQGVKEKKDSALIEYALQFDNATLEPNSLRVKTEEIKAAYAKVKPEQIDALKFIKARLESREKQMLQQELGQQIATLQDGIATRNVMRPIESVGCYVPGGLAVYPSSLIMTATPAKVAGVQRIVVCSPVRGDNPIDPSILVAADICGVDEVYKVGGAQAIAVLAYGTETILPVKKIVGPGNKYVMTAKRIVSQDVAIDMPAGPSEVLVLADETADPLSVACDMISQAEHTADSASGLITTSAKLADAVRDKLAEVCVSVERREIVLSSLEKYGFIITCKTRAELVNLANIFAAEHLEIITSNPEELAEKITTAGLVLLGPYTPVALSDYASGTNHVLPTSGFGATYSGLSVFDYMKRISIVQSSKEGLLKAKDAIDTLTVAERLPNHFKAVEARFEK
jgi:histidinol dehydrogenase